MVERHTGAQTSTTHELQSFDGSRSNKPHRNNNKTNGALEPQQQQQLDRRHRQRDVGRPAGVSLFSLFRWFGRRPDSADSSTSGSQRKRRYLFRRVGRRSSSTSSSSSADSFYSTATVRSFAFYSGATHQHRDALLLSQSKAVGPFAPGAAKLVEKKTRAGPNTSTLPSAFSRASRLDIETRYSLLPSSFVSYDSILERGGPQDRSVTLVLETPGQAGRARVHVRGKRRAPEPPPAVRAPSPEPGVRVRQRKRRPAPRPPGRETPSSTLSSEASTGMDLRVDRQTISNDTLVLRRGLLLPKRRDDETGTPETVGVAKPLGVAMPRPWYKRNEHSPSRRAARASSPQRLGFFHRHDEANGKNKRKSGVSILMNISELDREAAAIVREEQARNRASMILQVAKMDADFERRMGANEDIVQEIVNASMMQDNGSPRRSARALISRFNALGSNITTRVVGANASLFKPGSAKRPDHPPEKSLFPRRESAAVFAETIAPRQVADDSNVELAKTLAAELDDVASGIARLKRELDGRPRMDDQACEATVRGGTVAEKEELGKEVTRIFGEVDRQLKAKDSAEQKVPEPVKGGSITSQVAKVIDILVSVEKEVAAKRARSPVVKGGTKRVSGVDDRTTTELKKMLKEMRHSLAKRPETTDKPEMSPMFTPRPHSSTKVSSGVQTSGNVRRVVDGRSTARGSTEETHRGEYVELGPPRGENTYANVMEQSLYANAQVAAPRARDTAAGGKVIERGRPRAVKIDLRGADNKEATANPGNAGSRPWKNDNEEDRDGEGGGLEETEKRCTNTLAVNRLLRKLESAIASGHHQQAASLAKELAQLKIQCSVVRQRSRAVRDKLNLNMYIEDKQAHQGPIPLRLPVEMTVAQLKAKIHIEFEIPANVQRWIIGKNLADNDESTLEELQALEGSPVFLYLVAPPDLKDRGAIKTDKQPPPQPRDGVALEATGDEVEIVEVAGEKEAGRVINEKNDEQIHEIEEKIEHAPVEPELPAAPVPTGTEEPLPRASEEKNVVPEGEKLKRYEELMSLENCDVISNSEPIECPVCFMIFAPAEGVILRDCLHSFCRMCIANVVRYCEEAEVKCPYRDADYTCESTLQEREIKALVSAEVYQQHLAKSIAQAENNAGNNAFHCKTPDCPGWCIYDDNVNNFLCPVCKVNNCLTCQAIHMGKNCRQYQEELKNSKEGDVESKRTAAMLDEMVERGEALPCPTCAVVLMKKWGCDWLRCSMCKTEICWVTRGPRWGPGGKGDTSGGCRCGENGVKCHPRCNYCH
ncbi:uncharacterized protein LOC106642489 [Copidosoma floridanum]|uniref:uncharacterized protein LOC106642489 n=1 Tax=Copidosoma floridanum TaxID=29053 RepID=UPI0006C9A0D8|nr:uncharacterized protein LOC106642489 [Copidosoma floridanum]